MLDLHPTYSTQDIEGIARFIEKHYQFEGPVSCQMLQRGLNDVYLVKAKSGDRYVFRLSQNRVRGPADVKAETAFLMHLTHSGVPVAAPIPTRSGSFFVEGRASEGWRSGVLFHALDGRNPSAADFGDALANGRTLAMLHNAAETFSDVGALYRLDLQHLLWRPLEEIRRSGVVEDIEVYNALEKIAERASVAIETFSDLTWTYCHGDCHGFNARINHDGEAAFFDFDDSGPGYLAYDLAVFLWANVSFGRNSTPRWSSFIKGYRAVRPIASEDFEAAIHFVIVRHFWLMGEYATRANEWGSETVGWIAREADFLREWESEQLVNRLF
ncbi:phosphotransferase enzyme family protein [Agrobacterium tumefaciens]|uniref:phosphotransferase enzyme family protein n=1 Tax=Agrobacterium tumefaciens TaxID=358 RepID=UPI000233463D|nr:phosphotransferase [Agrobacterium tumefaciens]EHH05438.1 aminoglycoside phosphotransferase [Agrobacterium tumefaciens CCNWGS0286]TCV44472.1 Ser/Thr protein kinase RdoA (MazF antagonist) [Agrobacterium tumefaciens]UXS47600.1 phosphotransferase [Agrobacterium tumefaciens]